MNGTGAAAAILALAVSLHNLEEMIWLPGFRHPALPVVTPFQFRFAAIGVAALFWLLAAGLAADLPLEPVMAGFAVAMIFNAFIPHLALTLILRRYHPGLATGFLAVVPAAILALASLGSPAELWMDGDFLRRSGVAFGVLALSLPVLLWLGARLDIWRRA